jgi:Tol biopolymer transport system component
LFDSFDGKSAEIWQVSLADGSFRQLTHMSSNASFAAPSPDAQQMTYYVFDGAMLNLWAARIDGSASRALTQRLASATNNQCTFACHNAAWSPDSSTIAYSGGDHTTVWTMKPDGSNQQKVIANAEHNHFPWYLPDGRLGYITEHVSPIQSFTDAWAFDFKAGATTLLHEQMSPQGPFEWSRDGTKVLFHSPRAGNFDIYLIDLTAPGGVDALQGKGTEAYQAGPLSGPGVTPAAPRSIDPAAPAPVATAVPAADAVGTSPSLLPWLIGGGALVIAVVAFAVVAALRNRDSDI